MTKRMKAIETVNESGVLQNDRLEDVGHVLAAVGRPLQRLDELFLLDEEDRVFRLFEDPHERLVENAVAGVLLLVDLDAGLQDQIVLLELRHDRGEKLRLPDENFRQWKHAGHWGLDPIEHEAGRGGVDEVEDR